MTETPSTFKEAVAAAGIELPPNFQTPQWDPIPMLNWWNEHYSPPDGPQHWDGSVSLVQSPGAGQSIQFQVRLAESGQGAADVRIHVLDDGVVSLSFEHQGQQHPMGAVRNEDQMLGMLRVLRVLRRPRGKEE